MKLKNLFRRDEGVSYPLEERQEICCGEHDVCEKGLPRYLIEYYDDEELDVFRGRTSDSYGDDEVGVFSEVLETMWESDVRGWLRSLQLRGIELPDRLKDEVILIINSV